MKKNNLTTGGFTLIETMVSVLVLTVALSAFMTVVASSLFSARYANNEITANYLAQEAVDGIRNDRDTFFQQQAINGGNGWSNFTTKYGAPSSYCFSTDGCAIEVIALSTCTNISNCSSDETINLCNFTSTFGTSKCAMLNFDKNASTGSFYTYLSSGTSVFKREVKMSINSANPDQIDMIVKVEWKNGSTVKSRVLKSSLTNWQQ